MLSNLIHYLTHARITMLTSPRKMPRGPRACRDGLRSDERGETRARGKGPWLKPFSLGAGIQGPEGPGSLRGGVSAAFRGMNAPAPSGVGQNRPWVRQLWNRTGWMSPRSQDRDLGHPNNPTNISQSLGHRTSARPDLLVAEDNYFSPPKRSDMILTSLSAA